MQLYVVSLSLDHRTNFTLYKVDLRKRSVFVIYSYRILGLLENFRSIFCFKNIFLEYEREKL